MNKTQYSQDMQEHTGNFYTLNAICALSLAPFSVATLSLFGKIKGEEAFHWFLVGLVMLLLPIVARIKIGDFEVVMQRITSISGSMEELAAKMTKLAPRRFAILVYLISPDDKLALIYRQNYGKRLPLGKRLDYHEAPDEAVITSVVQQTGIEPANLRRWPIIDSKEFDDLGGHTQLAQRPFQVQREIHAGHRDEVGEHYDFVYVCLVDSAQRISGHGDPDGDKDPRWYSKYEVEAMHKKGETFSDVYPTFITILDSLHKSDK